MDTPGDVLSVLGHELRTPVASILGAVAALERGGRQIDDEARARLLRIAGDEARRLSRMLDDLLTAGRLDAAELGVRLVRVDLDELVREAVDARRVTLPARLRLELVPASGGAIVSADPDRLRQVITNILDNAVNHASGRIDVTLEVEPATVRVAIEDDGNGVPEDQREAIFDKFERLDSSAAGTGLGLWLSRRLTERMAGRVWVEATESGGARFIVELPQATPGL